MTDSPRVERARRKHNALVAGLARMQEKRVKLIAALSRNEKRIDLQGRAINRSGKRIDKLVNERVVTITANGAYTTPELVEANVSKPPAGNGELNDPVPTFGKLGPEHVKPRKKPTSGNTAEAGPPPAPTKPATAPDGAEPKKRKARRTPDDFRAEMDARKSN